MPCYREVFQADFKGDYAWRHLPRHYIPRKPPQVNLDGCAGSEASWRASFHRHRRLKPTDSRHVAPGSPQHLTGPRRGKGLPWGFRLSHLQLPLCRQDGDDGAASCVRAAGQAAASLSLAWACSSRAGGCKGQPSPPPPAVGTRPSTGIKKSCKEVRCVMLCGLQVKVLINAWDMCKILNLAEGALAIELLPLQTDSKEEKSSVCWWSPWWASGWPHPQAALVALWRPLHKVEALPWAFVRDAERLSKLPGGLGQHEELKEEKKEYTNGSEACLALPRMQLCCPDSLRLAQQCRRDEAGVTQCVPQPQLLHRDLGPSANRALLLSRWALAHLVLRPHLTQTLCSHFPKPAVKILLAASRLKAL